MDERRILTMDNWQKYLTGALVVAFLLNIHKVLIANALYPRQDFNEYLDVSIYLFDAVFFGWLLYLLIKHKNLILSNNRKMFHVEQSNRTPLVLIGVWIIWQWILTLQSQELALALRNALTMTEIAVFVLVQFFSVFHMEHKKINSIVPRGTRYFFNSWMIKVVTYFALFNTLVAFIQVSTQQSIGLSYLGESFLRVGNPGVATISIFGEKILRGYGLFVHPNILGAFLGLALLVVLFRHFVPRGTEKIVRISNNSKMFHVEQLMIPILIFGLLLTFSRTAIILTFLGALLIVPRGTILKYLGIKKMNMFHVEHKIAIFLIVGLIFLLSQVSFKSLSERELSLFEYAQISQFTLIGNGLGSYGVKLYSQLESLNNWSIQPIHNFFLFTYYELGLGGLFIIILLFLTLFFGPRDKKNRLFHVEQIRKEHLGVITFLTFFALSDHFFYSIPQGQIILWLGLLFISEERGWSILTK